MKLLLFILLTALSLINAADVPEAPKFYPFGYESPLISNMFSTNNVLYASNFADLYQWNEKNVQWDKINLLSGPHVNADFQTFVYGRMAFHHSCLVVSPEDGSKTYNDDCLFFSFESGTYMSINGAPLQTIDLPPEYSSSSYLGFSHDTLYVGSHYGIAKSSKEGIGEWDAIPGPFPNPLNLRHFEVHNDTLWYSDNYNLYWKHITATTWDSLYTERTNTTPQIKEFFHFNGQLIANVNIYNPGPGGINALPRTNDGFLAYPHSIDLSTGTIDTLDFTDTRYNDQDFLETCQWKITLDNKVLNIRCHLQQYRGALYFTKDLDFWHHFDVQKDYLVAGKVLWHDERYWVHILKTGLHSFNDPENIELVATNTGLGRKQLTKGGSVNGTLVLQSPLGYIQYDQPDNRWQYLVPPKLLHSSSFGTIKAYDSTLIFYNREPFFYRYDGVSLDSVQLPNWDQFPRNIYSFSETTFVEDEESRIFYQDGDQWTEITDIPYDGNESEDKSAFYDFNDNSWSYKEYPIKTWPWTDYYLPDSSLHAKSWNGAILLYDYEKGSEIEHQGCEYILTGPPSIIPYENGYLLTSGKGIYYLDKSDYVCRDFAFTGEYVTDVFYHNDHLVVIADGAVYSSDPTVEMTLVPPHKNPILFGPEVSSFSVIPSSESLSSIHFSESSSSEASTISHSSSSIASSDSKEIAPLNFKDSGVIKKYTLLLPRERYDAVNENILVYTITGELMHSVPQYRNQVYVLVYGD